MPYRSTDLSEAAYQERMRPPPHTPGNNVAVFEYRKADWKPISDNMGIY